MGSINALHLALIGVHSEAAKFLVQAGIDANSLTPRDNLFPVHWPASSVPSFWTFLSPKVHCYIFWQETLQSVERRRPCLVFTLPH